MDPRLLVMTPAERMAVTSAQDERRKMQARTDAKIPSKTVRTNVREFK